jgi:ABC-type branched-subunit amino acid transport system ATPase component
MQLAGQISIKHLKGMSDLEFDVPKGGVYLLCGSNGVGKSSVLACMYRLGFSNAFPDFFRTSQVSERLDSFDKTEIYYSAAGKSVKYVYGGQRWVPQPRKNAEVLDAFGFSSVLYIGANASRIEPRAEDFKPNRVRAASAFIATNAAHILDAQKFENLKVINVTRGTTNAFLLPVASIPPKTAAQQSYFSEKNFSLGELCVLKLLRSLEGCSQNSLLLIDEVELALHPMAQVRLLSVLEGIASKKKLTVVVATHSVSLINSVNRKQLLQLLREGDAIRCVAGPYHAAAIGAVTPAADRLVDCVLAVEDDRAATIVRTLVEQLTRSLPTYQRPAVQILPIGAFDSVIKFVRNSAAIVPSSTRVFGLIDKDVETENKAAWTKNENYEQLSLLQATKDRIRYLPWTPEVGIALQFSTDKSHHRSNLRGLFGNDMRVDFDGTALANVAASSGSTQRKLAKKWLDELVDTIAALRAEAAVIVEQKILTYFANAEWMASEGTYKALLMPLVGSR